MTIEIDITTGIGIKGDKGDAGEGIPGPAGPPGIADDESIAAAINEPGSESSTVITEIVEIEGSNKFARFNVQTAFLVDPQSVYGEHIRTAAPSGSSHYIHAFGVDDGLGGAIIVSAKKAGATSAVRLVQNPGASIVFQIDNYANVSSWIDNHYAGSAGRYSRIRNERGYTDGSMTNGSDILTSPSAAFTVGDVGATVSAISYSRTVFSPTIITATVLAYISATQVQLSRNATRTENPMYFTITNRVPSDSMNLWQVIDNDGSSIKYKFAAGWMILGTRIIPASDSTNGIFIDTPMSQSAHPFRVRVKDETDTSREAVYIGNLGHLNSKVGTILDNSSRPTSSAAALSVKNAGTSGTGKALEVISNDVVDTVQFKSSTGTIKSRINYDGRMMFMHSTEPGDSQLANGEATIWVDSTVGATKLKFKAKQSDGTVRRGEVALT